MKVAETCALLALVLGSLATNTVAEELPSWMGERRIIGDNDLEHIEEALGSDAYEKASIVARVETRNGRGFCTASKVAENIFLTNFHCFEFKPCEEIQFHMGAERQLPAEDQRVRLCKEVLAKDLNLDFALFRVEPLDDTGTNPGAVTKTHSFDFAEAIPDNDVAGITVDLAVAQTGTIADLQVVLDITHPWIGDLTVTLSSPGGTAITLHEKSGGSADNIQKAFENIAEPVKGELAAGDWTLTVTDTQSRDVGTLNKVELVVTTANADETLAEGADFSIGTLFGGGIHVGQELLVASHPAGRLKELDRSDTCVLRTVEPEMLGQRHSITHTCDTEGGSSGSPIIDRASGEIVALHWGGTNEYNLAIPMSMIVDFLRENLTQSDLEKLTISE